MKTILESLSFGGSHVYNAGENRELHGLIKFAESYGVLSTTEENGLTSARASAATVPAFSPDAILRLYENREIEASIDATKFFVASFSGIPECDRLGSAYSAECLLPLFVEVSTVGRDVLTIIMDTNKTSKHYRFTSGWPFIAVVRYMERDSAVIYSVPSI